ncbi:MAG: DNA replication/repair protein RecF [Prevotellaceae bacterium]|nr:DNA replication/repair protein RecF [Prevotellaceae bacterium]
MRLTRLSILNYKNITEADLSFSPKLNCFIGGNGEGKTNVLDAIHFLSFCRSYSSSVDLLSVRHGSEFMSLQGHYEHDDGTPEVIHCGLKVGQKDCSRQGGTKKVVRRGGKAYRRISEHVGLIPLVMVSPEDQSLVTGGSEERRRFMDMVICQYDPAYTEALIRYNKALQQRNTMLKQDQEPDPEIMLLWEEQMAREGAVIYEKRSAYITELIPIFQQFSNDISGKAEQVELHYVSHLQRGSLLEQLTRDRFKDRAVGYSLHGVHRDDIEMLLGGYPVRREGSQGQNKTFLTSLKLAQFDSLSRIGTRTTPLLLLDDIFDKLDARRVEQIVKLVGGERFGQIFITDTNRDHIDAILSAMDGDNRLFHVEKGIVSV